MKKLINQISSNNTNMPLTPQFPYKIVIGFQYSLSLDIYRPQRSWGKVMFSQACVILFTGGCLPQCMLGYQPPKQTPLGADTPPGNRHRPGSRHIPRADTPPGADTPWDQTHLQEQTPPWDQTPLGPDTPGTRHPQHRACWEIWSMRRQYASYWNAILF